MSADTMNRAIEALKSGQDVEKAAYGTESPPPAATDDLAEVGAEPAAGPPEVGLEADAGEQLEASIDEDSHWYYNPDEESTEEGAEETSEPSAEVEVEVKDEESGEESDSTIREVTITDHKGRRKIKVDFSDHGKIEKYIQLAAGFRKMQAERDQLKSQSGKLPEDVSSKLSSLDKLEEAWSGGGRQGIINVIDMLAREQGGYGDFIKTEYERMRTKEGASPSELERIELQERLDAESREREKLMRQMQEREERTNKQAEEADRQQLRASINPAFEKYRFDGKLGDPSAEASLDEAIWLKGIAELKKLPDDVELTDAVADKVFRDISARYRKMFKTQATKKVKQAVTNQKKAAGEQAAVKAMKGIKSNASRDEFRDNMKSGNWGDALASVLTGKVKL